MSSKLSSLSARSIVYYEARVSFGTTVLLAVLGLPACALISALNWRDVPAAFAQVMEVFELGLPLVAGIASAHLMSVEREERFDALRDSYPEPIWHVPLLRTLGALELTLLCLLSGLISFRVVYGEFDVRLIVLAACPPAIYLSGLALLVGNLAQNGWAASAAVIGYWAFEFQLGGTQTQTLFLFDKTHPLNGVNYDVNRLLLIAVGGGFMLANYAVYRLRRRGVILAR